MWNNSVLLIVMYTRYCTMHIPFFVYETVVQEYNYFIVIAMVSSCLF